MVSSATGGYLEQPVDGPEDRRQVLYHLSSDKVAGHGAWIELVGVVGVDGWARTARRRGWGSREALAAAAAALVCEGVVVGVHVTIASDRGRVKQAACGEAVGIR